MPKGKGKAKEGEEYKPIERILYFKPKKVTPGAVRFVETTASGVEKKNKGQFRTLYMRHDMPNSISRNADGELILPARLKVVITEE